MSLFYVGQTCFKVYLNILRMIFHSINMSIYGIIPRDDCWSIAPVLIKEVNKILKVKCSEWFFTYISHDSCWAVANGFLNPDLFYSDNVHLLEKGNLKLIELIFSWIKDCHSVSITNEISFLNCARCFLY